MNRVFQCLLVLVLCPGLTVHAAELKVGVAKRIITPETLLPVSGGLGPTSPTKEKRGDLTARAIVFQSGKTTVAVVQLDLLGFPSVLGRCGEQSRHHQREAAENPNGCECDGHWSPLSPR